MVEVGEEGWGEMGNTSGGVTTVGMMSEGGRGGGWKDAANSSSS